MKLLFQLFRISVFSFFCLSSAVAAPRVLEWDANPPEQLVTYRVYEKVGPGWVVVVNSVAGLSYDLGNLAVGSVHVWAVTAVNIVGDESEKSDECVWTEPKPPTPPGGVKIKVALQISSDLETWTTVAEHAVETGRLYARAAIITSTMP